MPASPTGADSERDPMVMYGLDGNSLNGREMPTPQGKDKVVNGDALLRAALDTDSEWDSDSELSDDPAPHACRELVNKPLRPEEKFFPHDTDPTKIFAVVQLKAPGSSDWYIQRDVLPEQRDSTEEDTYEENDTIFVPELLAHKVPPRFRAKKGNGQPRWMKVSAWRWERTKNGQTEVWVPKFVYRRFNARTHKYEHVHLAEKKMKNVDPNDKKWMYAYNKWVDQIKRRSDSTYTQDKQRDHWTANEICAMYNGFNEYLYANGIDAFAGMNNATLQPILDAINAAGDNIRSLEGLRGQINSAHNTKNKSIAYLRDKIQDLVEYMEQGGIISDDERFPKQFIPPEEFPSGPRANTRRNKTAENSSRTDKSRAADTETGGGVGARHDSSDGASVSGQWSSSPPAKKRKSSMSDPGDEEDNDCSFEDGMKENGAEVRTGGSASSFTKQKHEEAGDHPPPKKPRMAQATNFVPDYAFQSADSDDDLSDPPTDMEE